MSPSSEVKVIASLISIYLHLEKISERQQLKMVSLLRKIKRKEILNQEK